MPPGSGPWGPSAGCCSPRSGCSSSPPERGRVTATIEPDRGRPSPLPPDMVDLGRWPAGSSSQNPLNHRLRGKGVMGLRSIDLFHVAVPLKKPIRHASHERTSSDNLVVRVTLDDGRQGFGEGVPRDYVTGETIESTFATLMSFDAARHLGAPRSFAEVVRRLEAFSIPETLADPRGMAGNSARCALELAVLDAYGHRFGQSLGKAIPLLEIDGVQATDAPRRVRYSGAITADDPRRERIAAWKMRIYGFSQTKLKVGVAGQDDPKRLAKLRRILGRRMDLRLDANEAWTAAEVIDRVRPLLAFSPSVLEQPVPHAEVDSLSEMRPK